MNDARFESIRAQWERGDTWASIAEDHGYADAESAAGSFAAMCRLRELEQRTVVRRFLEPMSDYRKASLLRRAERKAQWKAARA